MLANLLARYNVQTIILERDAGVNTDPRGIALDEDGIRYLQACGVYDKIFTEMGQCTPGPYFCKSFLLLRYDRYAENEFRGRRAP